MTNSIPTASLFTKAEIAKAISLLLSGSTDRARLKAERQILYWQEIDWINPAVRGGKGVPARYFAEDAAMLCIAGYLGSFMSGTVHLKSIIYSLQGLSTRSKKRLAADVLVRDPIPGHQTSLIIFPVEYSDKDKVPDMHGAFLVSEPDGSKRLNGVLLKEAPKIATPLHIQLDLDAIMAPLRLIAGLSPSAREA